MSDDTSSHIKIGLRDKEGDVETPWAERLTDSTCRLLNTPFYFYGLSWGDIIEVRPEPDGMLFFHRVLEKSGHRTVRVLYEDKSENKEPLFSAIKSLNCSYEGAFDVLICIDIPPEVSLEDVTTQLNALGVRWESADPTYEQFTGEVPDAEEEV